MEHMRNKQTSIYMRLTRLLLMAACISAVFFALLDLVEGHVISLYLRNSDYIGQKRQEQLESLQDYITDHKLYSENIYELRGWLKTQPAVALQIFMDGELIYDSYFQEADGSWEVGSDENSRSEHLSTVELGDGEAAVFLRGFYVYHFYTYAFIVEIILSSGVFVLIVLAGIQKTIRYIRRLQSEIEILEGGDLDYSITVSGRDELASLAAGLDAMRVSLKEQMEEDAKLTAAYRKLVTEVSHDLRTPLTSLMIYTEILRRGDREDKEQLENYIDKIHRKAHQIKILSDHIFEYSLVSGREEVELEEAEDMGLIFYDSLSEMAAYLEQQGYGVTRRLQWNGCRIRINQEYISRILDNITSNILKYARQDAPVQIGTVKAEEEEAAGIYFENRIEKDVDDRESTKIGIQSVEKMMQKMGGYCQVEKEEELFKITLWFPAVREE